MKLYIRSGNIPVTNLLINEPPLQVLPSLATAIGLNEAIIVQQIHYWIGISKNYREGHKWVYKTFDKWREEFPFWSTSTIKRTISNLEKSEVLISTEKFNKMGFDRTKWYRINYEKLRINPSCQNDTMNGSICDNVSVQNDTTHGVKMTQPITREYTENTSENTSERDFVVTADNSIVFESVISYLNQLAGTNYKHTTKKTQQLIRARYKEGFTVDDFKLVIDKKVATWSNDPKMMQYIRPETLFGTKFESYLNEKVGSKHGINQSNTPTKFGNVEVGF